MATSTQPNPFKPFQPWWQRMLTGSKKRVDLQQVSMFTRQFAVMVGATVPIMRALQCFWDTPEPEPIHEVVESVCRKVESGESLSDAMRCYPSAFNPIYCGLIRSGESSGRLHQILFQLADTLEKDLRLRKKLTAAMTYPCILLLAAISSVVFFLFVILPVLEPLFTASDMKLPLPTLILLNLRRFTPWGVVGAVVLAGLLAVLRKRMAHHPKLEYRVHELLLYIPYFGSLYSELTIARILRSMATMFEVGLSTLPTLRACESLTSNRYLIEKLQEMRELVMEGEPMSESMSAVGIFPQSVIQMVAAGEESSQLSRLLSNSAEVMDWDNDMALDSLPQVIEPIIMLVMGLVVGFVILATLLPIVSLIDSL